MKDKETLFRDVLKCKFDTPKKLNRADKAIPTEVINQLESGQFTCEMIEELKGKYPIFFYQTCITIHGFWGNVERTYIGGYKHIHQNQNGSLEIFYPCIDIDKIKAIQRGLRDVSDSFNYQCNSTSRAFIMSNRITKETHAALVEKYRATAERIKMLNIYGSVHAWIQPTVFGTMEIVLQLNPCAIPAGEVNNVILGLTGYTQEQYNAKVTEVQQAREQETKRREAEDAIRQAERQAQREQTLNTYREQFKAIIDSLPICNDINAGILVKPIIDSTSIKFVYYRIDGKGTFGRVKWSKAYMPTLETDVTKIEFKEQSQQKLSDFKLNDFRLLQASKQPEPIKPQPTREKVTERPASVNLTTPVTGVQVVNYSDKALAVFGDTMQFKDLFKKIGGKFNPFLNNNGTKQAGWIFSKRYEQELNRLITA
jgi:hypothetical protein